MQYTFLKRKLQSCAPKTIQNGSKCNENFFHRFRNFSERFETFRS